MPFFFKWAIDGMTADPSGATPVAAALVVLTPPAMLIMYGVARASAAFCNELRNAVFAKVRAASGCIECRSNEVFDECKHICTLCKYVHCARCVDVSLQTFICQRGMTGLRVLRRETSQTILAEKGTRETPK